VKGLKHAALAVYDLKRAQSFYESLGFKAYHDSDKDWLMLSFRETTLSLVKVAQEEKIKIEKSSGVHPAHLGFLADSREEVDSFYKKIQARGDVLVSKVHEHRDLSYGFYFYDTEGNNLEFIHIPTLPIYNKLSHRELAVLWVHGSQKKEWAAPFDELILKLKTEDLRRHWTLAHLEGQGPRLESVVKEILDSESISTIKVIPLFLSVGKHVREDLSQSLDSLKSLYPEIKISLASSLLENEVFQDFLLQTCLLKIEELSK
jgi:sirohydrochlorin cobaltochelatase